LYEYLVVGTVFSVAAACAPVFLSGMIVSFQQWSETQ
jgi:hypothetical protein